MTQRDEPGEASLRDAELVPTLWAAIRAALESERRCIADAISRYPPPIPACDEHFNALLERRERVGQQLARAKLRSDAASSLADCRAFLDELIGSPGLLADDVVHGLRAQLREA